MIALEEDQAVLDKAARLWQKTESFNIAGVAGNLCAGAPQYQPFDIIFLNGAVSAPPEKLLAQLKEGGVLLTVLIEAGHRNGYAVKFRKGDGGHITSLNLFNAACPYLAGFYQEKAFVL